MNSIPNCKSRQGLAENQILKSDPLRSIGDIFCKDLCSRQVDSQVLKQTFSRPKNLVSPTWRKTSAKRRSPRIGFQGPHDVRRLHDDFQSQNPSQQPLKPSAKITEKRFWIALSNHGRKLRSETFAGLVRANASLGRRSSATSIPRRATTELRGLAKCFQDCNSSWRNFSQSRTGRSSGKSPAQNVATSRRQTI
jgi:hypothetical protein